LFAHVFEVVNTHVDSQQTVDASTNKLREEIYRKLIPDGISRAYPVKHPITFDLMMSLIKNITQLPEDFAQCVPFFNPKAIEVDITSGITGNALNILIPGGIKIKLDSPVEYPYRYELKVGNYSGKLDLNLYYNEVKEETLKYLLAELNQYFMKNTEMAWVNDWVYRAEAYERFLKEEEDHLHTMTRTYKEQCRNDAFDPNTPTYSLVTTKETIKELRDNINTTRIFIEFLNQRTVQLESFQLQKLVSKEQFTQFSLPTQTDKSFYLQPLPDYLVSYSAVQQQTTFVTPRKALLGEIASIMLFLREKHDSLTRQVSR